ncbi:hypothetical protein [Nocardia carnea]|uniref:hypothetical protein n=1 Tax=Nocardia carnea TaxID=37328 RepID=UPI002458E696|nr:hypothetical protein [Nocardia carnea]
MNGQGGRPGWRAVLKVVLIRGVAGCAGLALTLAALFFLSDPINVIAYYLGHGEEIQVEVIEGAGANSPKRTEPGEGRVLGQDRIVGVYGVTAGEVVTARPRLLDLGAEKMRFVYTDHASVLPGLLSIFGCLVLGLPGLLFLLVGFGTKSLFEKATPVLQRFNDRMAQRASRKHTG